MNPKVDPDDAIIKIEKYLSEIEVLICKSNTEGEKERIQLDTKIRAIVRASFIDDEAKLRDLENDREKHVSAEKTKQKRYIADLEIMRNHLIAFREELELFSNSTKKEVGSSKLNTTESNEAEINDKKDKSKVFATGIISALVGVLLIPFIYNSLYSNNTNLITIIEYSSFTILFLGLGLGCFIKPDFFGPIIEALVEMGKNVNSRGNRKIEQHQNRPTNSPQINAEGPVTINYPSSNDGSNIEKRKITDKLQKEMDLLVSPLYAKSQGGLKNVFFMKGVPGYIDSARPRDKEYFAFWDAVTRNKYLAPDYLRFALDNYLKNKSNTVGDTSRDFNYENAERDLIETVMKRYEELQNQL